ncbi:unnamed protein product [Didymodactylos carnosus]|uniref:Glycosyltransferase family 28 N-terminal domain-containing protein n=1 Tax=Didymodactylos carnosus TaxID=1234261 RepID=A0A814YHB2_9BILA|nr:unnamed protein product [Didymodactylos carnosus]CAF1228972.1 unnamed protein product [Didymodactylos carnosus]CAF3817828.1 unnamed protein product [Didymodactylos carnosus]CAF3991683.1 unnamed protein product [Didymodactylos carnosus]
MSEEINSLNNTTQTPNNSNQNVLNELDTENTTHSQYEYDSLSSSNNSENKEQMSIPLKDILPESATNMTGDGRISVCLSDEQLNDIYEYSILNMEEYDIISTSEYRFNIKQPLIPGQNIPRLAICIMIVGSRGDVQPFIAFGKELLKVGHRVRLATHEIFRKFVKENGLEFFPLGGNPAELMAFMVKNAGIIPHVSSIVSGDIYRKRKQLAQIIDSTWKACVKPDDETGAPFTADAIISNPPTFGHIHCAQKLGIPLHICFTMPWSPTTAFPHPLFNVDYSIRSKEKMNYLSYEIVGMFTWVGMKDLINHFRRKVLNLKRLSTSQAINIWAKEKVPHTYCWSPAMIPKPIDWGEHIDVSGFFMLDLATNFTPSNDLIQFLKEGSRPIYVGFGSITGDDPVRLTNTILEAIKLVKCRAIISEGWGGIGKATTLPDNIYLIGNCPHDWLFEHVDIVCHHGGAGTTATGLKLGKPTVIVPFFGDQFFWGDMIYKIGAGPSPLPGKTLKADQLADAFRFAMRSETRAAAQRLAAAMKEENGVATAVQAFHAHLPLDKMISDLESTFPACFSLPKYDLKISLPVAQVLLASGSIDESELKVHPVKVWDIRDEHERVPWHRLTRSGRKAFSRLYAETTDGTKQAQSGYSKEICAEILSKFEQNRRVIKS